MTHTNDWLTTIQTRRSIRRFKPDPVPREILEQIVRAGTYAATGMNRQSPIILAVTNREVRGRLSRLNAEIMGAESDPFYSAPAVLVVLAKKQCAHRVYDGSLVMGNLMLAAHALGIGSCWIHRAKEEFERPEGLEILRSLGIEGDYEGIGHCVLGYVDGDYPEAPARKENWAYFID
ncbi:MAG: nitroreductase family protein [Provencibacterium sp.]|jgi:nitroreductase|nr:nitroreductase family protein [Provencibacterium sp.]